MRTDTKIRHSKLGHLLAAASAVLLIAACDAGTGTEEAELETGTDVIAETEPTLGTETELYTASAFEEANLADLDTDQNDQVSRVEYDAWFDQQVWSEWDTDADDQVAQAELGGTFWGWWDRDGDGAVDQEEYAEGRETFAFENVEYPDFGEMAGDDQRWSREEFDPWFEETLWVTWDTDSDQQLGRQEAADTFWQWWDENGDDQVDAGELARFDGQPTATTASAGEAMNDLDAS